MCPRDMSKWFAMIPTIDDKDFTVALFYKRVAIAKITGPTEI